MVLIVLCFSVEFLCYEGGSESSVIGVVTLLIDMIDWEFAMLYLD